MNAGPYRPAAVFFDVIETLMSLAPLRDRLAEVGQDGGLLDLWFARTLRDGAMLAASGDFRPFPEVAASALRHVTKYRIDDAGVDHVLRGFGELPAHDDVEPAMRALERAGITMACLTNGSAPVTERFLDRCDLSRYVVRVVSAEEAGSWKPPAKVYHHATDALGLAPRQAALVAAHAWDCHGAKRAGLTTGWVSRSERGYAPVFLPPDVRGDSLTEVAERLCALPARSS